MKVPILVYYDPNKETILQTDASFKELGACLLQQGKSVYFASKALTETQKGYAAIELESLVVVWAMEKFHHFLYGTHFILEADQKLLEAIVDMIVLTKLHDDCKEFLSEHSCIILQYITFQDQ